MVSFYLISVLYQKKLRELRSLPQFIRLCGEYPETEILIFDNSEDAALLTENREEAKRCGISYLSEGRNLGLSAAYNRCLLELDQREKDRASSGGAPSEKGENAEGNYWIFLSDDDSLFSMEYLRNVRESCLEGREAEKASGGERFPELRAGMVRSLRGPLSPKKSYRLFERAGDFVRAPGHYRGLYCINSGLCICRSLLRELGDFEERIFLDMLDYWLMDRLREKGLDRFWILPGEIRQDFSGASFPGRERAERRYRIYRRDFQLYCRITGRSRLFSFLMLFKRRLRLSYDEILHRVP